MGLDLTLMPFYSSGPACNIAHTMIDTLGGYVLHDLIAPIEDRHGRDVPEHFYTFRGRDENDNTCYGITIKTPYGERLKYVQARHLAALAESEEVQSSPLNRAAWAYLKELPPDWRIALYWH